MVDNTGIEKSMKGYIPGCQRKLKVKRRQRSRKQAKKKERKLNYIKPLHICYDPIYIYVYVSM